MKNGYQQFCSGYALFYTFTQEEIIGCILNVLSRELEDRRYFELEVDREIWAMRPTVIESK